MSQIGSFVPAEAAILGTIDRMFTRIHTMDSTQRPESTFTVRNLVHWHVQHFMRVQPWE